MTELTNQQRTAAEVITELVKMAKEVAAEADRGKRFTPPLTTTNCCSTTSWPRAKPPWT
ncbi:hypothetical protein [Micrococcus luteus]|uniref:hypothetical protein n=1 Tax=Micrococcus luteus TaxID=1270 RepID=UPI001FA51730|nr:hypothetical protein [Micrococcus luteus]MCD0173129.1 hypothetical protein [Micrococcus luteus]MCD0184774.1 hypothetical protein [Micrococcus luteus]